MNEPELHTLTNLKNNIKKTSKLQKDTTLLIVKIMQNSTKYEIKIKHKGALGSGYLGQEGTE